MADSKLTDDHRLFVVQAIARFHTPQQVVDLLKEGFGVVITRQTVESYDPTKVAAGKLKKWRPIFEATRKKYLEDVSAIPIAHRGGRLQALQRAIDKAERQGNVALVKEICETAAKEQGDVFTNKQKREHDVTPGGELQALLGKLRGSTLPVAKVPAPDADG